jgi:magnesium-transporting ATPase (P-type)
MSQPIHALRVPEVFDALATSPEGLKPEEVAAHQVLYGANLLAEPTAVPIWRKLAVQVTHPMAWLLLLAGVVALVDGRIALSLVIWIVVLVNAGFSFWQEYRAERSVADLKKLLPDYARILRGGAELKLPASEVVPGDVLILAEGDNVPADARVVEEYGLRVNNASLTGEAVPARKTAEASLRDGLTEIERPNLIFAGTSVVSGTGRAVVFAVGMMTQFGRIANLTQAVKEEPSLLQQNIEHLTRRISLVAVGLGFVVFAVSRFDLGWGWSESFFLAIGLIVAAIPEGLLPTVTLTLAIAVQRLAEKGVLVKQLSIVETLGTTSVICTDKSGTLTQNQMTVREVWAAGQRFSITGVGYEPQGDIIPPPTATSEPVVECLLTAALLCNNARLNPPTLERPYWSSLGDQTEVALRTLALKGGLDEQETLLAHPRIHELPFDARRKRMSTIHRNERGEVAYMKGAPKEVLQLCTQILMDGQLRPLDETIRAEIIQANDDYARSALRVLGLAYRHLPPREGPYSPEAVEREMIFLGLAGMMDPPRPEVEAAVQTCRAAGIRMVMITGDYGLTAESVARRVGLLATPNPHIVTGTELDELSDEALQAILNEEAIFARVAPEHKLRLVAAFQARGDVVAVSGDGVNDVPALRKADVGIAMGITGTDVAKQAADVIITDDNFGAIVQAIAEGRAVYDNLRKFMTYIFASNVPEVMPFIMTGLFGLPLALTVPQILAIDLGTDVLPALALGMEKPEPDVMKRPPRARGRPLVDSGLLLRAFAWLGMIETVLCYFGFFLVYALAGDPMALPEITLPDWLPPVEEWIAADVDIYMLATTVFLVGVVMAQVGNVFTCRTEVERVHRLGWFSNRFLWGAVIIEVLLILAIVYIPLLAQVFNTIALPLPFWLLLITYAPILYVLDRIRKSIARRLPGVMKTVGQDAILS